MFTFINAVFRETLMYFSFWYGIQVGNYHDIQTFLSQQVDNEFKLKLFKNLTQ